MFLLWCLGLLCVVPVAWCIMCVRNTRTGINLGGDSCNVCRAEFAETIRQLGEFVYVYEGTVLAPVYCGKPTERELLVGTKLGTVNWTM